MQISDSNQQFKELEIVIPVLVIMMVLMTMVSTIVTMMTKLTLPRVVIPLWPR